MKSVIIVLSVIFSLAIALPFEVAEDESGQAYYLVPLHRHRRQTSVGVQSNGAARVSHQGKIFDNGNVRLDGGAFASKQLHPSGPLTVGGKLNLAQPSTGSGLNIGAAQTRGYGTDLSTQGKYNLYNGNGGNTRLDAVGQYSRHYGGQSGTQHPNYYGGLQFSHRF